MDNVYYSMTEKNKLKENFLYIPKKFKKYLKRKDIVWIYKIINLKMLKNSLSIIKML